MKEYLYIKTRVSCYGFERKPSMRDIINGYVKTHRTMAFWFKETDKFKNMNGFVKFEIMEETVSSINLWTLVAVFDTMENTVLAKLSS